MNTVIRRIAGMRADTLNIEIDDQPHTVAAGDTVLTAVLASCGALQPNESFARARGGFCLMGACQDCWVRVDGRRQRACTTMVADGMRVATSLTPQ